MAVFFDITPWAMTSVKSPRSLISIEGAGEGAGSAAASAGASTAAMIRHRAHHASFPPTSSTMRMPQRSPTAIRFRARDEPVVDPDVERRAGGLVERDDRPGAEAAGELGEVHAYAAELDGDLERHVVEQGLERLRVEARRRGQGVGFGGFAHDLLPCPCRTLTIWTARTPRHTTGLAHALSTPSQNTGTCESTKPGRV